jgi:hypothetical protein
MVETVDRDSCSSRAFVSGSPESRSRCFIAQLDMPVYRHRGLTADTRLDDINLVAALQKLLGLFFD